MVMYVYMNSHGVLYALNSRGQQDDWMQNKTNDMYDVRKYFLRNNEHKRAYMKLKCTTTTNNKIGIQIDEDCCDLVNNVDLYITMPKTWDVNTCIKALETESSMQRLDAINDGQPIETAINTDAEIFGTPHRKVRYMDCPTDATKKLAIVPLYLAPFYETNLACPSLAYHRLMVNVYLAKDYDMDAVTMELYGDCYYFYRPAIREWIFNDRHQFVTIQHQGCYAHDKTIRQGVNRFRLYFNHPVHCMYFWGFDKTKVKRIRLCMNDDCDFYDGAIEPLEYFKLSRGITAEPVMIIFSEMKFDRRPQSTVNFSQIDNPVLIIETEQTEETQLHMIGLNVQGYTTCSGMMGLVYSK
jgi:hypothetical protein